MYLRQRSRVCVMFAFDFPRKLYIAIGSENSVNRDHVKNSENEIGCVGRLRDFSQRSSFIVHDDLHKQRTSKINT